ncbi:hypothetical protein PENSPDRAFT_293919 [Peniophora sp. CONT]|nr:hypothetical protein PENSPDRAFT_293919 [Peniophora sp. CONT]
MYMYHSRTETVMTVGTYSRLPEPGACLCTSVYGRFSGMHARWMGVFSVAQVSGYGLRVTRLCLGKLLPVPRGCRQHLNLICAPRYDACQMPLTRGETVRQGPQEFVWDEFICWHLATPGQFFRAYCLATYEICACNKGEVMHCHAQLHCMARAHTQCTFATSSSTSALS